MRHAVTCHLFYTIVTAIPCNIKFLLRHGTFKNLEVNNTLNSCKRKYDLRSSYYLCL